MRKRWLVGTAAVLALGWGWPASAEDEPDRAGAEVGTPNDDAAETGTTLDRAQAVAIELRTMLEKGLKARRPEEFEYLAQVSQMVSDGQLSENLVRSTFAWARKKRPYPFQYFQRALQVRAKRLGVRLPTV